MNLKNHRKVQLAIAGAMFMASALVTLRTMGLWTLPDDSPASTVRQAQHSGSGDNPDSFDAARNAFIKPRD